jgi:hypothetical protein
MKMSIQKKRRKVYKSRRCRGKEMIFLVQFPSDSTYNTVSSIVGKPIFTIKYYGKG